MISRANKTPALSHVTYAVQKTLVNKVRRSFFKTFGILCTRSCRHRLLVSRIHRHLADGSHFWKSRCKKRAVDVRAIRSRYIQENLRRALNGADSFRAWYTASEFRRYFQWFADSFDESDRRIIADQLAKLEALCANSRAPESQASSNNDRVGQQFQEPAFN